MVTEQTNLQCFCCISWVLLLLRAALWWVPVAVARRGSGPLVTFLGFLGPAVQIQPKDNDQEGSWREGPLGSAPNEGETCMFHAVMSSVHVCSPGAWRGLGVSRSCLGQELMGSEPSPSTVPMSLPICLSLCCIYTQHV